MLGSGKEKSLNESMKQAFFGYSYRGKSSRWERDFGRSRTSFLNMAKQFCSLRIVEHFDV